VGASWGEFKSPIGKADPALPVTVAQIRDIRVGMSFDALNVSGAASKTPWCLSPHGFALLTRVEGQTVGLDEWFRFAAKRPEREAR
jgi:hypothetical protein